MTQERAHLQVGDMMLLARLVALVEAAKLIADAIPATACLSSDRRWRLRYIRTREPTASPGRLELFSTTGTEPTLCCQPR
jgi:hypothetical protein